MAHVKAKHFSVAILRTAASLRQAWSMAATPLSGRLPWRRHHLLVPRTGRLQPGAADSRCLFSISAPVSSTVSAHSFHPRPSAPPNPSLKWTPNGVPPGPRSAFRLSCTARAWRHTAGVHLAPTLGIRNAAVLFSSRKCACRRELNSHKRQSREIHLGAVCKPERRRKVR